MYSLAVAPLAKSISEAVWPDFYFSGDQKLYYSQGLHQLLSQTVFLLLTDKGSIASAPDLGTEAKARLSTVAFDQTQAIEQIISEITSDLISQLKRLTLRSADDAKYKSLTIEAIGINNFDSLEIFLQLESAAGESINYRMGLSR